MLLDKKGEAWEIIQRYYTDDYTYYFIRNIVTKEENTITDWQVQKHFFEVPCV
jgi:hypothetical protein